MSEQPNSVQLLTPELKEEFKILFGEFVQKYLSTPKGQKHVDIHLQSVRDAKLNFKQAVEMDRKGQDITDFVLEKLLPHQNTKNNRKKRAWIHPAPAVTKDLKSWFEGAKWASKEDWPDIAYSA